ncbi:hypothetical protein JCM16161A_17240 [Vulcanisaeta sp. JCM 16161]|uniref:hypothetical protein n=1 Tax=Vulcanisaeta sp. JCM 16161 TaxID=1295372 RepID=UPI0006D11CB1|nr:hypothetical protein [Vulcanisaeta sp. JCM 16161]
MPRRKQGYNLTHVLIALMARKEVVRERELRRLFSRRVYPYLMHLEAAGVITIKDGVVAINTSFKDLINLYLRDIEKNHA